MRAGAMARRYDIVNGPFLYKEWEIRLTWRRKWNPVKTVLFSTGYVSWLVVGQLHGSTFYNNRLCKNIVEHVRVSINEQWLIYYYLHLFTLSG